MFAKYNLLFFSLFLNLIILVNYAETQESDGSIMPEQALYGVAFYDLNLEIDPVTQTISGFNIVTAFVIESLDEFIIDLNTNCIDD